MKCVFPNRVHVVVVPRLVSWVTGLLEEEGLYGALKLHEFCPDFIPLNDDLLSLEMTSFFRYIVEENLDVFICNVL